MIVSRYSDQYYKIMYFYSISIFFYGISSISTVKVKSNITILSFGIVRFHLHCRNLNKVLF